METQSEANKKHHDTRNQFVGHTHALQIKKLEEIHMLFLRIPACDWHTTTFTIEMGVY